MESTVEIICSLLSWEKQRCTDAWVGFYMLIKSIRSSETWSTRKESEIALFWTDALSDSGLEWTDSTRDFVTHVMALGHMAVQWRNLDFHI
jgi:hypothetical protein